MLTTIKWRRRMKAAIAWPASYKKDAHKLRTNSNVYLFILALYMHIYFKIIIK